MASLQTNGIGNIQPALPNSLSPENVRQFETSTYSLAQEILNRPALLSESGTPSCRVHYYHHHHCGCHSWYWWPRSLFFINSSPAYGRRSRRAEDEFARLLI